VSTSSPRGVSARVVAARRGAGLAGAVIALLMLLAVALGLGAQRADASPVRSDYVSSLAVAATDGTVRKRFASDDVAALLEEQNQDAKRLNGDGDASAGFPEFAGADVHLERAEANRGRRCPGGDHDFERLWAGCAILHRSLDDGGDTRP